MSTDLSAMTYPELIDLQASVKSAIDARKPTEEGKAKKEWLASDAAKAFLSRLEALRKVWDKIGAKCDKSKSVVLKVKMTVDVQPNALDDLIEGKWSRSLDEFVNVGCNGELLNKGDCGDLDWEIQNHIDSIMEEVCEEAVGIHGSLHEDIEHFSDDYNMLVNDLDEAQPFGVSLGDVVRANSPKKTKKRKKK